ncbi:MAG: hypothetical protein R3B47_04955 [Bacteroidia bacterium]
MTKTRLWQSLHVVAALFALTMNTLANALPLYGRTTGELSDLYPNLFVPAGFTFSIWGLIYLLLIAFLAHQFLTRAADGLMVALAPWLLFNLMMNGLWIIAWHSLQIELSVVIMLGLLISLVQLNIRLRWRKAVAPNSEKWLVRLFISIYLGWISVATIANVTALLISMGINGGSMEVGLTVAMILSATILGLLFIWLRGDWPYALVIAWALFGIYSKRMGIPDSPEILIPVLYGCLGLLLTTAGYKLFFKPAESF